MKKTISIIIAVVVALCATLFPVDASLLGMPLNLKGVIAIPKFLAPTSSCQFYAEDVLTGPLPVSEC